MKYLILFILLCSSTLLTSCASTYSRHALGVNKQYANTFKEIGEISEHIIDFEEGSYVFLAEHAKLTKKAIAGSFKSIGFQGFGINALNYRGCQELGRLWLPKSRMRKRLISKYGKTSLKYYDPPKMVLYDWHKIKGLLAGYKSQSWILFGPEIFEKKRYQDVTTEDLKVFFAKIKKNPIAKAKLEYIGTANVPVPPAFWGKINYFNLVSVEFETEIIK